MKKSTAHKNTEISVIFSVTDIIRKKFRTRPLVKRPPVRINYVNDSYGNSITPNNDIMFSTAYCKTNKIVNAGDIIEFFVDAKGSKNIEYSLDIDYKNIVTWQSYNVLRVCLDKKYISKFCQVRINIRESRKYQALKEVDSCVIFSYQVR